MQVPYSYERLHCGLQRHVEYVLQIRKISSKEINVGNSLSEPTSSEKHKRLLWQPIMCNLGAV